MCTPTHYIVDQALQYLYVIDCQPMLQAPYDERPSSSFGITDIITDIIDLFMESSRILSRRDTGMI